MGVTLYAAGGVSSTMGGREDVGYTWLGREGDTGFSLVHSSPVGRSSPTMARGHCHRQGTSESWERK